jgi:hypothetical protein
MNHVLTLRGILTIIFYKSKIITGETLTGILVVFCLVMPNGHYSSKLNFSAYISEKVDHRFLVIFSGQIKLLI